MTLDELIQHRDRLIKNRLRGIRGYEIADRKLEFKTDAEMQAAIAAADAEIARAEGKARVTDIRISTSKGA